MESAKSAISSATGAVSSALGYNSNNNDQHHDQLASDTANNAATNTGDSSDPTYGSPATTQGSRTVDGGAHDAATRSAPSKSNSNLGADLEQTLSGPRDPAVQGEDHPKLTGDGAPGSHSAVFGLTPDGKRHDDTTHGQAPVPKVTE